MTEQLTQGVQEHSKTPCTFFCERWSQEGPLMLSVSVMHSASLSGSSHLVYPCGRGRMTLSGTADSVHSVELASCSKPFIIASQEIMGRNTC